MTFTSERERIAQRIRELEADPAYRDHPLMAELHWLAERYFRTERQLRKVSRIGDLLQNLLLESNEAFEQASLTDPLTGLPNRRAMLERLAAEANRCERQGLSLAITMADLDDFKGINDNLGHEAGDAVLEEVGRRIEDNLRNYDYCARWGGEEFLVLLPGSGVGGAHRAAERIREKVLATPVTWQGEPVPVAVSLGVAVKEPEEDLEGLVRRADVALYQAKRQGRNRTVVAPEDAGSAN